jgi:hypothetical protein
MSERDGYEHGVPSWIAGAHADPEQAAAFYTELMAPTDTPMGRRAVLADPQGAPFSVSRVKPA